MNKKILTIYLIIFTTLFFKIPFTTNAASTNDDVYTIDRNNSSSDKISIEFGRNQSKLFYEIQALRFVFDKSLRIEGNNSILGYLFIALDHIAQNSVGQIFIGKNDGEWESIAWDTTNKRFNLSDDLNLEGDLYINGTKLSSSHGSSPSFSRIKILPKDFEVYEERGGISNIYNFGASQLVEYGQYGVIASITIPEGYKATKTRIYGDGGSFDINIYECTLNSSNCSLIGNGNINALINHQDVIATDLNFLSIIVDETKVRQSSQYINGGYVLLEKI